MNTDIYVALISIILGGIVGYFIDIKKKERAQNQKWHDVYIDFGI